MPTLILFRRDSYGMIRYYPEDPSAAQHLRQLTRRQTIEPNDVAALEALGLSVLLRQPDHSTTPAFHAMRHPRFDHSHPHSRTT